MRLRSICLSVVVAALLTSGTVSVGASTGRARGRLAPSLKLATYSSVTGIIPLSQACGDPKPANVLSAMSNAAQLGVKQVRCDLNWWTVQPFNGTTFDWSKYDSVVNAAAHYGLNVMFTVGFTPPWARPNPLPPGTHDPSHVPPVNVSDFVAFANAAVDRYSKVGRSRVPSVVGSVTTWQIWNEPNISGGWTPADPVRYGKFLAVVASNIRHIDARATILSGGLSPAVTRKGNYYPPDFVAGMAPTGALQQIDAIAVHPYTFPAYPDEKIGFNPIYRMVPLLHSVMSKNGMANKKIWATETGWPTSSQSPESIRPWNHIQVGTEAYQAKELPLTLVTWFKLPYAGPLFIYAERDACTNNKSWLCKMGLERYDGTKKPAWTTVHVQLAKPILH